MAANANAEDWGAQMAGAGNAAGGGGGGFGGVGAGTQGAGTAVPAGAWVEEQIDVGEEVRVVDLGGDSPAPTALVARAKAAVRRVLGRGKEFVEVRVQGQLTGEISLRANAEEQRLLRETLVVMSKKIDMTNTPSLYIPNGVRTPLNIVKQLMEGAEVLRQRVGAMEDDGVQPGGVPMPMPMPIEVYISSETRQLRNRGVPDRATVLNFNTTSGYTLKDVIEAVPAERRHSIRMRENGGQDEESDSLRRTSLDQRRVGSACDSQQGGERLRRSPTRRRRGDANHVRGC